MSNPAEFKKSATGLYHLSIPGMYANKDSSFLVVGTDHIDALAQQAGAQGSRLKERATEPRQTEAGIIGDGHAIFEGHPNPAQLSYASDHNLKIGPAIFFDLKHVKQIARQAVRQPNASRDSSLPQAATLAPD